MVGNVDIALFKNLSIERKLNKHLVEVWKGSAVLQTPLNDASPTVRFTLHNSTVHWRSCNYMRVSGAYYFIDSVEHLNENLTMVTGRIDLLMTYRETLLGLRVSLERSTNQGNEWIIDDQREFTGREVTTYIHARAINLQGGGYGDPWMSNGAYVLTTSIAS